MELKLGTNALLTECFMHELIIQNPYEAFLMKCILTDDPREIYTNVIETLIPVSEVHDPNIPKLPS